MTAMVFVIIQHAPGKSKGCLYCHGFGVLLVATQNPLSNEQQLPLLLLLLPSTTAAAAPTTAAAASGAEAESVNERQGERQGQRAPQGLIHLVLDDKISQCSFESVRIPRPLPPALDSLLAAANGRIDPVGLLILKVFLKIAREELNAAFRVVDIDGNGSIDRKEFAHVS